ncbi:MAG: Sec-independent protein translocase protein TatA [Myxococcota bacterium]|nr:Sec-independent protein translocase protein TatA [Myxococcota bacterium]
MNFGFQEIILLLVVALLIFGPRKLPELATNLGKALRDFRKVSEDFKSQIQREVDSVREAAEADDNKSISPPQLSQKADGAPPEETAGQTGDQAPEQEADAPAASTPNPDETPPSPLGERHDSAQQELAALRVSHGSLEKSDPPKPADG